MAIIGSPTPGNDSIQGDAANNLIDALAGNDTVNGNGGDDTLIGGLGDDQLLGAVGNDNLIGGEGNDILVGDIFGGAGNDSLNGGAGSDILNGGLGRDTLVGGTGSDTYSIGSPDAIIIEQANEGNDIVNSFINYTLGANLERLTLVGTANISGFGNALSNTILGNSGNNFLSGLAGDDTINGLDGDDNLIGGDGNDILAGSNGNDFLQGGTGNDNLNGGAGIDTVRVNAVGSNIILTNNSVTGEGVDTLNGIENAELFVFQSNSIPGNIDASAFTLGSVTLDGGTGSNNLIGSIGNDFLDGEGANDTLTGGSGNDTLNGGSGDDLLAGGAGSDRFVYETNRAFNTGDVGLDTITSFSLGSDKIVLSKTTFAALESAVGGALIGSDFESVDSFGDIQFNTHEIIYHRGLLIYNENGTAPGIGNGGVIADFTGDPNISAADFLVVA
jgi:Ca2+-binding RTX toxin-like protein